MYGEKEYQSAQGEQDFFMIDFGDGIEKKQTTTGAEGQVFLEPQVSQAERFHGLDAPVVKREIEKQPVSNNEISSTGFITIDFDAINTVGMEPKSDEDVLVAEQPEFMSIDFDAIDTVGMESKSDANVLAAEQPEFMSIDFDAINTVGMEPKSDEDVLAAEQPEFMSIDFGTGVEDNSKIFKKPIIDEPMETPTFTEFSFDEEPVMQRQEAVPVQAQVAYAASPASPPPEDNRELANRVVFVVPGENRALMIYDQSPEGPEAEFAGHLPEGKFHASGMEVIDFDPGKINDEYSIVRYKDGSCVQRVIVVDEKTFLKLALQGMYPQHPEAEHRRHYMVIDMSDETRDVRRETVQAVFDEDQGKLDPNQKAILDAAIDVSGDEMRNVVINGNSKGQK